jgi:hypothetical protein
LDTPIWDLFWTLIWDTPILDPDLGPRFGTPPFGTYFYGPDFETNAIISKIKQNSSDMNEIILAPSDAGYVQNCTGYYSPNLT